MHFLLGSQHVRTFRRFQQEYIVLICKYEISMWRHGGLPRFAQLCQFSAVSGSIGIFGACNVQTFNESIITCL